MKSFGNHGVVAAEASRGLGIPLHLLWRREYLAGKEEGAKERPCALVATLRSNEFGETRALVLPVTHTAPDDPALAVEIPAATKRRLRLDGARSWVVLSEWNEFVWPGYDLRPIPGLGSARFAYGVLPPALFAPIRDKFLALVARGQAQRVERD